MKDRNHGIVKHEKDLLLGMPFTTLNSQTFQALFYYASIGILITDSKGVIQMANKYVVQQFGYEEQELVGETVELLIPDRYRSSHHHHRDKFNANPHSRPMGLGMELTGKKKTGEEVPVEISLGHYSIGEDRYTLAFINDITQRKETEQAIKKLNVHLEQKVKEESLSLALTVEQLGHQIKETERKDVELQRVNNFLNNIYNHAGAIIVVCDRDGIIQFFNPAAEKSLGYAAHEVLGVHSPIIFHRKGELEEKAKELSELSGLPVQTDFSLFKLMCLSDYNKNMECHYVRKDESAFYVSLDVTPLKDDKGKTTGYLAIAIDISEKKKAETELRSALEKEKELNELKSRFVSMASHEFRTPLSAILSSAYLLSQYASPDDPPQKKKHIQRIVSSVTSLTEILNDFLSVGKIEEGKLAPRFAEYDIQKQMMDVIQDVQHMLKNGQHVDYTHVGADAMVYLDPSTMKHIVTNLLSNAIKFSGENTTIELVTENNGNNFILSVKDYGIGIPKEEQEHLFKRFFRSSNVTNIQGTGLGLHIVAKYSELLNGAIECESDLGKGTKFTITFNKIEAANENNSGN